MSLESCALDLLLQLGAIVVAHGSHKLILCNLTRCLGRAEELLPLRTLIGFDRRKH